MNKYYNIPKDKLVQLVREIADRAVMDNYDELELQNAIIQAVQNVHKGVNNEIL
jgi:hypothetical protein